MPNKQEYITALTHLLNEPSQKVHNGFLMLTANYRAEHKAISAARLAKAVGYEDYSIANAQYGSFAHKVCDFIGFRPEQERNGFPIWTFGICDESDYKDKNGHLQWILKPELAEAMQEVGIVSEIFFYDILEDISNKNETLNTLNEKDRDAIIKARIGQGKYRENIVRHWGGCSVTGYDNTDFLVASHIKPWRDCNPGEALDMTNGLLLLPNLDQVFDKGFISFDSEGCIIISPQLDDKDAGFLSISSDMKLRWCYPQHDKYLKFHRRYVFRNGE